MIFAALYQPRREIQAEYEVSPYYPKAIRFDSEIEPTVRETLVRSAPEDWILAICDSHARHSGRQHSRLPGLHLRHADRASAVRSARMIALFSCAVCSSCCFLIIGSAGDRNDQER